MASPFRPARTPSNCDDKLYEGSIEFYAAPSAEGAQPIELENIGRGRFFAKFLFAGCAETLDAIVDAHIGLVRRLWKSLTLKDLVALTGIEPVFSAFSWFL
jgi:hypothetical protein